MSSENPPSLTILLINMNEFLLYFRPILFTICMIGTCLDILLFSRRRFRTVSCCIYFLASAITVLIQYSVLFGLTAYGYDHANPITSILSICKIYAYVQQSTGMIQRWFMVAATFDRYACTSRRAGLRSLATARVARRVMLVIVVTWLMIAVFRAVFYTIEANTCAIFDNNVAALIHGIYVAIAGAVLPLLIMISSLVLIQHNLARKRQRRQNIVIQQKEGRNEGQEFQRKRDQQILAILLVQVIVYIALVLPLSIMQIYNGIPIPNKSIDRIIIEQFAFSLADTLADMYSAVSFYLNTITSRMFRDELMIVVRNVLCCRWLSNTNRIEPFSNNITTKTPIVRQQSMKTSAVKTSVPNRKMLECVIEAIP